MRYSSDLWMVVHRVRLSFRLHCAFFVYMHHIGFREIMQYGREGKTLHAVHIRLVDGSPEGRNSLQTSLCFYVDMHHIGSERSCRTAARGSLCLLCTFDMWMADQRVELHFRLHCAIFVVMHHNGFREVMQNGREGRTLRTVHIQLVEGSTEGRISCQTSLCHFLSTCITMASERSCRTAVKGRPCMLCLFVVMLPNGFREVMQNGREGEALHLVHRLPF